MRFFLFLALSISLYAAQTTCSGIYYQNDAPDIVNTKLSAKTKELCFQEFAVMHSGISRTPLWSAEHLTREQLEHKTPRTNDFHAEERLPLDERAELRDYARSGYDRGHQTPSADMSTEVAQHESFSFANLIPQAPQKNRGIWSAIEGATRHLTNQKGELYVITGPLFIGGDLKRIGRVLVPTHDFKAIFDPLTNEGGVYVTLNDDSDGDNYQVISIAQLEKMANINLFPFMSTQQKERTLNLPTPRMHQHGSSSE